jgi:two-component SAPR family response regulator
MLDSDEVGSFIRTRLLDKINCELKVVKGQDNALEFLKSHKVDFVFIDLLMVPLNAIEFVHKCKRNQIDISNFVVFYSSLSKADKEDLINVGIKMMVERPLTLEKLQSIFKEGR